MTEAISSFGTLLKVGDGAGPEVFTAIAEVKDISGPTISLATAEVTHQQSTDGFDEFVGTINSGGEVTFAVNYIPTDATHDATDGLISICKAKTLNNFQLVFPDGASTTWTFAALVTRVSPTAPVNGALTGDVTLKISGSPTLA